MNEFYFLCKVKFDQMQENGSVKKVTEQHLVHAISFSEAENLIAQEIAQYTTGETEVVAVTKQFLASRVPVQKRIHERRRPTRDYRLRLPRRGERHHLCTPAVHYRRKHAHRANRIPPTARDDTKTG